MTKHTLYTLSMGAVASAALLGSGPASASTNLVTNPDFAVNGGDTGGLVYFYNYGGQVADDWTLTGGTAWGLRGVNNGNLFNNPFLVFPNPVGVGGDTVAEADNDTGYNYVFADAAPTYAPGFFTQSISGLTPGATYTVSFYEAFENENAADDTTAQWAVNLGGNPYANSGTSTAGLVTGPDTSIGGNWVTGPSVAISGAKGDSWTKISLSIKAGTSAVENLSFEALGTGAPPYALLDGVSLTAGVPEPAAWGLMIIGIGFVGAVARMRRRPAAAAAKA